MCIANQDAGKAQGRGDKTVTPISASEVPLGTGLADNAKVSILSRRERIRKAIEAAGG